jgi:hypothetical protein
MPERAQIAACKVLRDGRDGMFIINIPGLGYSFVASVDYRSARAYS